MWKKVVSCPPEMFMNLINSLHIPSTTTFSGGFCLWGFEVDEFFRAMRNIRFYVPQSFTINHCRKKTDWLPNKSLNLFSLFLVIVLTFDRFPTKKNVFSINESMLMWSVTLKRDVQFLQPMSRSNWFRDRWEKIVNRADVFSISFMVFFPVHSRFFFVLASLVRWMNMSQLTLCEHKAMKWNEFVLKNMQIKTVINRKTSHSQHFNHECRTMNSEVK